MPIDSKNNDFDGVDTCVFDYGGVVSFHYCEPWQGNLSALLGANPKEVRALLSETSTWGRDYRLGHMSRDEFWGLILEKVGASNVNTNQLELNWAKSYQIDRRMVFLMRRLRQEKRFQIGILSNSDAYRQAHIEATYRLSQDVDFIVSSHTHGVVKPEPDAYLKVLKLADRCDAPHRVMYIDDRERNVTPAIQLGMRGRVFSSYEDFATTLAQQNILTLTPHAPIYA